MIITDVIIICFICILILITTYIPAFIVYDKIIHNKREKRIAMIPGGCIFLIFKYIEEI